MWVSSTGREAQWRPCGQTVSEVLKFCSAQDTEISSQPTRAPVLVWGPHLHPAPSSGLCTQQGLSECQQEASVLAACLLHSNLEVRQGEGDPASTWCVQHLLSTCCMLRFILGTG